MSIEKDPRAPRFQNVGDLQIDTPNFNLISELAGRQIQFSGDFIVSQDGNVQLVALATPDPETCRWFRCSIKNHKDRELKIEEGWIVTPTMHLEIVAETTITIPNVAGKHAIYLEHTPGATPTVYALPETFPLADPDPFDQGHVQRKMIAITKTVSVGGVVQLVSFDQTWCGGFLRFDAENHLASFWAELKSDSGGGSGLQDWEKVRWDSLATYSKDLDFPWTQDNAGGQCVHANGAGEAYPTGTLVLMQRVRTAAGIKNVYTIPALPGFWAKATWSVDEWTFAEYEPNAGQTAMVDATARTGSMLEVNDTSGDVDTPIVWVQPTIAAGGGMAYCFELDDDTIYTPPDPILNRCFTGKVSKSGTSWTFVEQKHTGAGTFSTRSVGDGGTSGACSERNGLAPPAAATSFYVDMIEYTDGATKWYSFNLPIHELGSAYELLRTDATSNNWEWGCGYIS